MENCAYLWKNPGYAPVYVVEVIHTKELVLLKAKSA